jgi:hypothetical protein
MAERRRPTRPGKPKYHHTGPPTPTGPGQCQCRPPWPILHATHHGHAHYTAARRHDLGCGLPPTPVNLRR